MRPDPKKVKAVFVEAVQQRDPKGWDAFLEQACGDDPNLREEVEVLLKAHVEAGSFLDKGAVAPDATIDRTPITEQPGTVIGPYKLLEQIGEGGMGVVFMAQRSKPVKQRVALKIVKPGMDTKQFVARFEAERQALAMMDHPNIAKVLDGGATESGRPFYVMELVKGTPITEYCDEHHLTARERLELFVPVCRAIQHAHQKGIVHRDIKPSNVLIAEYDDEPVPKIIDFGVAKALHQELTEKTMFTRFGQVVGTFEYMSPEQAKLNQRDIDTRSDIYSLGVLLYELLAGATPFDKSRLQSAAYDEVLRIIREEEPPKPSTRISTLGETAANVSASRRTDPQSLSKVVRGDLDCLVMTAIAKDRSRRYDTASSMATDIENYLNGEPLNARPPSATYRLRKLASRHRAALATVTLVMLALVIATVSVSWSALKTKETEEALRQAFKDQVNAAIRAGDVRAAQELIVQLRQADAHDLAVRFQAVLYLLNGQAEKAIEPLKKLLEKEPDSVILLAMLVHAYDAVGDYGDDCLDHQVKLQELTSRQTINEYVLAPVVFWHDHYKGWKMACEAFERHRSPIGLLVRGFTGCRVALFTGNLDRLETSLKDVDTVNYLLDAEENGMARVLSIAAYNFAANAALAQGNTQLHQSCLERARDIVQVIEAQESPQLWELLHVAHYYRARGDLDLAFDTFTRMVEERPSDKGDAAYQALAIQLGKHVDNAVLQRIDTSRGSNEFSVSKWARAFDRLIEGDIQVAVALAEELHSKNANPHFQSFALDILSAAGESDLVKERAEEQSKSLAGRQGMTEFSEWHRDVILPYYVGKSNEQTLLERSKNSRYPIRNLHMAHWILALEHLGRNELTEAREHFQSCIDQRLFCWQEYALSHAFLVRLNDLKSWPPAAAAAKE
jgi:serine/threonine protein kinase/tetratricopeptide (TPR) repeat protein